MTYDIIIGRNEADRKLFKEKGTILVGKQYVKMGQTTSLSNPVYMDVAGSHVVFIVGKRGSGKCLHGDTLITLSDGSQAKIKDLETKDQGVFTLDENLKIRIEQKTNFYRRPVGKLLEIKFRTGRAIQVTPKHQLSLFLNRLFSCDGTIYKKVDHWFISYCSSSDQLIGQVQHLLLRFGITSRIRKKVIRRESKHFQSNELEMYGESVNQYLQEIGFYGKKEERAAIAIEEAPSIIRNPNVDTIPKEIWDIYRPNNWAEIGRKIGYAHPKAMRERIHYAPSRQTLLQIAKADESDLLSKFACSDIFWDEIVSLNYLEGEFEVYDLTVPETQNFVANDIIVHNSYSMGAIAEGLADLPQEVKQNLSIVLLDTMGIYWTMKYPNFQDAELVKKWGFEPKSLNVKIYTPSGFFAQFKEEGIPTDFPFSIRPLDVNHEDWCMSFDININSPEGVLITKIVQELFKRKQSYE